MKCACGHDQDYHVAGSGSCDGQKAGCPCTRFRPIADCQCGHRSSDHMHHTEWCAHEKCSCANMRPVPSIVLIGNVAVTGGDQAMAGAAVSRPPPAEHQWACSTAGCPPRATVPAVTAPRCYTCGSPMDNVDTGEHPKIWFTMTWRCVCGYRRNAPGAPAPSCYVCGSRMSMTWV